jgi:CheY-like chemotaxis protein
MSRVLLIEDDRWLAESYASTLEKARHEVVVVASAGGAMDSVEQIMPDVILADVMLEGHTIFALLHELQSYDDTRDIPVVLCSGLSKEQLQVDRLKSYGVVDILSKTDITPQWLQSAIQQAVAI